jgi:multisubunit Na+/H+ antiporter MnhF subunit
MFALIAARFVLVDTEGWFWIRTVRGHSVQTELVALDVLHHEAQLVVAIGRQ